MTSKADLAGDSEPPPRQGHPRFFRPLSATLLNVNCQPPHAARLTDVEACSQVIRADLRQLLSGAILSQAASVVGDIFYHVRAGRSKGVALARAASASVSLRCPRACAVVDEVGKLRAIFGD
jgi:hypothetical protein